MPAVAAGCGAGSGWSPKLHDPDLAVAKGAALLAMIESVKIALPVDADGTDGRAGDERAEAVAAQLGVDPASLRALMRKKVTGVVPRAFGVKVLARDDLEADEDGFVVDHLLPANTELPATPEPQRYGTAVHHQPAIAVEVWEQAGAKQSRRMADNLKVGEGTIEDLPPLPRGAPITITFAMDELGTLRVHAVEATTGRDLDIELRIDGLSADELSQAQTAGARYTVSG